MEVDNKEALIPYYNGQLDAYARCCALMTTLGKTLVEDEPNQIKAKYLVARTGETMLKIMDNTESLLNEIKKGMM